MRAELDAYPRAQAAGYLGDAVQPGPLAAPPITSRSPWPTWSRSPGPPDFGRSPKVRWRRARRSPPSCRAGSRGRCGPRARRRCRCRRGTGRARRDERLAELLAVVGVQRRAGLVEHRMGQRLAPRVPGEEPRDPHGAVVHVHPLLVPRHGADQRVEQLVGRGNEPGRRSIQAPSDSGRRSTAAPSSAIPSRPRTKQRRLDDERHGRV